MNCQATDLEKQPNAIAMNCANGVHPLRGGIPPYGRVYLHMGRVYLLWHLSLGVYLHVGGSTSLISDSPLLMTNLPGIGVCNLPILSKTWHIWEAFSYIGSFPIHENCSHTVGHFPLGIVIGIVVIVVIAIAIVSGIAMAIIMPISMTMNL